MARELRITYETAAANLYAVIRRTSDAKVWQTTTSTFVVWVNGDIANYDIALTDRGGDLYDGDFPTAIVAGNYDVYYYERAGAAPAITDLPLDTEAVRWNGVTTSTPIPGGADWYYADQQSVVDLIGTVALEKMSNEPGAADDTAVDTARLQRIGEWSDQYIDGRMSALGYVTPLANMSAGTALLMEHASASLVAWKLNEPRMLSSLSGSRNARAIDVVMEEHRKAAEMTLSKIAWRQISITADKTYDRPPFAKVYVPTYSGTIVPVY